MNRVYVTGLGFITSIGNSASEVSQSLRSLRHGFELYPPFQKPEIPVKVVGTIKGFDTESTDCEDWQFPERYLIKREILRGLAPHGLFAYCSMVQAIEDAQLSESDISNPGTGLFAASGGSPYLTHYHHERMHKLGVLRCSPMGIVSSISGTLNFNLVACFRILGASCGFSSACASSSHALGYAFDEIRLGRQKRMFVVGGEDGNTDSILPFAGMRALSLQHDPDLASRPFDQERDGFVGSGGAAVVILESEEEVARRGVSVYAEVAGWGQASDGYNVAISHPQGTGIQAAMSLALASSGVRPEEVDYVNAHATSTPIGDASEAHALKALFSSAGPGPAVSSTKALTGHGLSLAGAMETGFCALSIREGYTPGSAHIRQLDPSCDGLNVIRETLPTGPSVVLNNSSGFGGANVCLILRRASP